MREKLPLETLPTVQAMIVEVNHELQRCGRLVVRYSGTKPVLRIMIESDDATRNERLMEKLLTVIRNVLA